MGTALCSESTAAADNDIFLTCTWNILVSLQIKSRSEPRAYTQEEEKGRE